MSELILTEQLTNVISAASNVSGITEPFKYKNIPRLNVPKELTTGWVWESLRGTVQAGQEVEGVYLGHSQPEYALWPYAGSGGGSGKASPPYLRSYDGIVGFKSGDDIGDLDLDKIESAANGDGTYRWNEIEYCQWQKRNGRNLPPRAKATIRVYLLYKTGEVLAVCIPGTSHKFFEPFQESMYKVPGKYTLKMRLEWFDGMFNRYVVVKTIVGEELPLEAAEKINRLYVDRVAPLLEPRTPSREAKETVDVVPF